ncbi:UvrABC system protein C [Candidatus Magnetaquicoccaceae bacterium FCR-1]|uniref:UvrABC system protein C n=1 Tax=Candidatus Magnetaquiglobus chichijimensis TaxID=3141448 RepID=A0ABQ0C7G5_9PROT
MNDFASSVPRETVDSLPDAPGVYRYLDADGQVLYVGKAKSLKKRVGSYFHGANSARIQAMLAKARDLAIIVTASEADALILEANLIRRLQPPYNVLLKDDKSHPWLRLTINHPFPRLTLHRGPKHPGERYFGPYPSVHAVRETLKWLQGIFPLRQCEERQFTTRRRPCLQHQIKRCHAPCMGLIDSESHGRWVKEAILFLEGRDRQLIEGLTQAMWEAAETRRFEEAARLRDRIKAIRHVQEQRRGNLKEGTDLDVLSITTSDGPAVIEIFFIRDGIQLGNQAHFPDNTEDLAPAEVLESFIAQFYAPGQIDAEDEARDGREKSTSALETPLPPPEILVNLAPPERGWLEVTLSRLRGGAVKIRVPERGEKRRLVDLALTNAETAKIRSLSGKRANRQRLAELAEILELPRAPERIEAFDISHIQDTHVVASLVAFGPEGMIKKDYRRFAIRDPDAIDDTSRMAEVLRRRFRDADASDADWPDLVLLDGGKGQLNAVVEVAGDLGITGVTFCAIAKGPDRDAGKETLFLPGRSEAIILPERSSVLFMLQNIRDEAHRFAVTYHRGSRGKELVRSALDDIPGVGPNRKKALLRRFGSVRALRAADVEELEAVPGISAALAETIVHHLRNIQETT